MDSRSNWVKTTPIDHEHMAAIYFLNKKIFAYDDGDIANYKKQGYNVTKNKEGQIVVRHGKGPYPDELFSKEQLEFLTKYLLKYEEGLEQKDKILGKMANWKSLETKLLTDESFLSHHKERMLDEALSCQVIGHTIKSGASQVITVGGALFPLTEMVAIEHTDIHLVELDFRKKLASIKSDLISGLQEKDLYPKDIKIDRIHFDLLHNGIDDIAASSNIDLSKVSVLNLQPLKNVPQGDILKNLMKTMDKFSSIFSAGSFTIHNFLKTQKVMGSFKEYTVNRLVGDKNELTLTQSVKFPKLRSGGKIIAEVALVETSSISKTEELLKQSGRIKKPSRIKGASQVEIAF